MEANRRIELEGKKEEGKAYEDAECEKGRRNREEPEELRMVRVQDLLFIEPRSLIPPTQCS